MIKAPVASTPPAVVVKLQVAAALVLAATRSDAAIENEVLVTWPPTDEDMIPDAMAADAAMSDDVDTLIPTELAVEAPILNPLIVTVNADTSMVPLDVVMITEVAVVAPHVAVSPSHQENGQSARTLLASASIVGVTDGAKKPEG